MKYEIESSRLELKQDFPENNQIIKTVVAFSNATGGKIVIGVEDSGTISGIDEIQAHEAMEWLDKMIYESCVPPIIPLVYQQRIDNKVLLIIEVSSGNSKPYYIKSQGLAKGTYIRLGRSTVQANADMIEELKWRARGIFYDQLPIYHATEEDLNLQKVEYFFSHRRNGAKVQINQELLDAYHITAQEHQRVYPSVSGILLFGKDPQKYMTESYILCSHFSGVEGREAIASRAIEGTLFEQFDGAFDFVVERLNKAFTIREKKREEILEIPSIALREALMNAILHRNYHIPGPIKIAVFSDRIEIFSPGSFPGPIDSRNLESGITYVRNPYIAKILWESEYIEKMGSGLITIFKSYREYGLKAPDVLEGVNYIKCILPRSQQTESEDNQEQEILDYVKVAKEVSRKDIIARLKIPKTTLGRILNKLVSENKLVRRGKGPKTTYRFS